MRCHAFADCDAPSTMARWSEFTVRLENHKPARPSRALVRYGEQHGDACPNSDIQPSTGSVTFVTNTTRTTPDGTEIHL